MVSIGNYGAIDIYARDFNWLFYFAESKQRIAFIQSRIAKASVNFATRGGQKWRKRSLQPI
jgi:predicted Zn-dependent protease